RLAGADPHARGHPTGPRAAGGADLPGLHLLAARAARRRPAGDRAAARAGPRRPGGAPPGRRGRMTRAPWVYEGVGLGFGAYAGLVHRPVTLGAERLHLRPGEVLACVHLSDADVPVV